MASSSADRGPALTDFVARQVQHEDSDDDFDPTALQARMQQVDKSNGEQAVEPTPLTTVTTTEVQTVLHALLQAVDEDNGQPAAQAPFRGSRGCHSRCLRGAINR